MRVYWMRTGICIDVSPLDRRRLCAILVDRNSPQKHVWRARIVLLTADGGSTNVRPRGASPTPRSAATGRPPVRCLRGAC